MAPCENLPFQGDLSPCGEALLSWAWAGGSPLPRGTASNPEGMLDSLHVRPEPAGRAGWRPPWILLRRGAGLGEMWGRGTRAPLPRVPQAGHSSADTTVLPP